jgi:hypothetical protein
MYDSVNPNHYNGTEALEAIQASMSGEAFKGFLKGNCQKYLWRYEHKNGKEDLLKCQWYLNKLIETIETDKDYAQLIENTKAVAEPKEAKEPTDPDAYMISGCPSFRQGPPEPLDDNDCWKRAYG